jgi:RNA polymerase sigma factor (sigma-70 family)
MSSAPRDYVASALSGDAAAWAEVQRQHRDPLHRFCQRFVVDPTDAADAVQETFLKAWQHRDSFRGESSFKAWLYRIAQNLCLNRLRQRGAPLSLDDEQNPITQQMSAPGPSVAEKIIARQMLAAVLQRLKEPDLSIFLLHYQMGMTSEEISRQLPLEMQLSPEGVRSRLSRNVRATIEEIKREFNAN